MCSSSSVPTIRSQSGRIACRCCVTVSEREIALLARAVAGEAPEIGPVVDVEDDLAAVLLREAHRLASAPRRRSAVAKCVPVTTTAPAEAMKASSMSLSSSAMSAQSLR